MTTQENFNELVKYLSNKGCKFSIKETYNDNGDFEYVSIFGATWYKEGKFYKVNNVVVSKSMLSIINDFIPMR